MSCVKRSSSAIKWTPFSKIIHPKNMGLDFPKPLNFPNWVEGEGPLPKSGQKWGVAIVLMKLLGL